MKAGHAVIVNWSAVPAACLSGSVALWVPVTLHTSRHLLILVEQSAESVVSSYVVDLGGNPLGEWT